MAWKDMKQRLMGLLNRGENDSARRPDGGTSFYRPIGRKKQEAEPAQQAPSQDPAYIHTGFTGMNPPADPYAYGPQTAYGQPAYGQPAAYGQQGAYAQPAAYGQPGTYGQPAYGQSGAFAAQTGWSGQNYDASGSYGAPAAFSQPAYEPTAPRPERGWFGSRQERKEQSNISYMPGYSPDNGASFTHVEHIMVVTGLKTCYEAIECMKNGETLILTLDAIANDSERMRCQDMLAGAAFTLGCAVRSLQGGQVVIIAPESVKILPEESIRVEMPQRSFVPQPEAAEPAAPLRRERRVSANADWNAARRGERPDFNPYTGSMPAAAGAYAAFGGYGT